MKLTPLVSSGGNHSPWDWAHATTSIIFQTDNPAADQVRNRIIDSLAFHYREIIDLERELLKANPEHCAEPYGLDMAADIASKVCQIDTIGTPFEVSDEWREAAYRTIGDHLATAVHIERLLYADAHPENPAAVAYRARFHK